MPKIFIVDDWLDSLALISTELKEYGFEIQTFSSGKELLDKLKYDIPDLFLIDINMPDINGFEVLAQLPNLAPGIPAIMMTGVEENLTNLAVKSIKNEALDFIEKTESISSILNKINRVLVNQNKKDSTLIDKETIFKKYGLIAVSQKMIELCKKIEILAKTNLPILIVGETGVGKELIARAIHSLSPRANEIFLPINCGAIVDTLAESELFGHTKGAFTGAINNKAGFFKLAEKGSLFLDEITESNQSLQVKLLRALDPGEFSPIGGSPEIVKTRIIASTNRVIDIINKDNLRKDLYYRLESGIIKIPALRERREDIAPLAEFFLEQEIKINSTLPRKYFSNNALDYLKQLKWEGNVRELKGIVRRLFIFAPNEKISQDDVMKIIKEKYRANIKNSIEDMSDFFESHKEIILEKGANIFIDHFKENLYDFFLNEFNGNKSETARKLKIKISSFRKSLLRLKGNK